MVLCSESLEHVSDYKKAMSELLRVAKKAVVITVPHEPEEHIEMDLDDAHDAHIHNFDLKSFDYLKKKGYKIRPKKISAKLLEVPCLIVGGGRIKYHKGMPCPKFLVSLFNVFAPVFRVVTGKRTAAFLGLIDDAVLKFSKDHKAILFMIYRSEKILRDEPKRKIGPLEILNTTVPYHYLDKKKGKKNRPKKNK